MARIRTIKPEFFTSEDIVALSPLARLLYIALWCEADKEGRLAWKPRTFKMRYLPADDCDIDALCEELTRAGLAITYGNFLAYIPSFAKHQHVNPRESKSAIEAPPGVADALPRKVGKTLRELVFERDGNACVRCGSGDRLECDHILPQSIGGPHLAENLRTLCKSCNAGRPVSGPGLVEDLAKDGYSLESLRAKFGIDASNLDLLAQGGREGKGREGKEIDASPDGSAAPTPKAKRKPAQTPLPEDFAVSDRVQAWAESKGHTHLTDRLESFKSYARRSGKTYADWDEAFMSAIREDWAKLGNTPPAPPKSPAPSADDILRAQGLAA